MNKRISLRCLMNIIWCVSLMILLSGAYAFAEELNTRTAPAGYTPTNTYLHPQPAISRGADTLPRVLLIEDNDPWKTTSNQQVLSKITSYDKVTTKEFLSVDLSKYGVVVFANDQPFSTYENYAEFKEYLEVFANIGGVIVFGACDAGWANGSLIEALPGDVTKKTHYVYNNYVVNSTHPIVTGVLTDNKLLTNDMLYDHYCSHVSFNEDSLPAGSTVILRESDSNRPTLVEYPLGKGRVIASGLTWEFAYQYHYRGDYALTAMEDMFRYAIRVSSIDVDELYLLEQWKLQRDCHAVIVVEAGIDLKNLKPIEGATVQIGSKSYTTDSEGKVLTNDYGNKVVTVSANGYTKKIDEYKLEPSTSRIIFMDRAPVSDKPVLLRASVAYPINKALKDVRSQSVSIPSGSLYNAQFIFVADWKGHGAGTYRLYQGSDYYKPNHHVDLPKGYGTFDAGNYFAQDQQMKIILIAADGTTSDPVNLNIYIDEPKAENFVNDKNHIEWLGRNKALTTGDIFFTLVSNLVLDVLGESIPVDMKVDDNDDGSSTYKLLFGFAKGEDEKVWEYTEKGWVEKVDPDEKKKDKFINNAWDDLTDKIKKVKEAGGIRNAMKNLKENLASKWNNAKPEKVKVEAAKKIEVDFMGYIESTMKDGKVTSAAGGLMGSGAASGKIGSNFMAGPVPMYIEFTIDGKVETYVDAGLELKNAVWSPKLDFEGIELQLIGLKLGVGAGVRSVATLGGWGKGEFKLTFLDPDEAALAKGEIKFGGGLEAKVLWVIDWEQPIAEKTWQLFPAKQKLQFARMAGAPQVALVSRSYLNNETEWSNGSPFVMSRSNGVSLHTLQMGVMPDAIPQLYLVDDKLVMLYLDDDAARSLGNHTRLMYSVYSNDAWTDPQPVWNSNTADYFFDCVVVDDKLHVVWQKAKEELNIANVEDAAAQLAENAEICYAVWTAEKGFTSQQYLTNNSTFDMMPAVTADRRGVYAVWANNNANDIYGNDGTNTINTLHISNGKPGNVRQIQAVQDQLLELVAGVQDNQLHVLYTALNSNSEMVTRHVSNQVREVETTGIPAALNFEDGEFRWLADGIIYSYDPKRCVVHTLVANEDNVIAANYQYLTNGSNKAVVWFEEGDEGQVKICTSVPNGGKWSLPVVLAEFDSDPITFSDAVLLDDGNFALVFNTAGRNAAGDMTNTALKYVIVTPVTDVELQDATLDYPDWTTNKQSVNLLLKNNSIKPVNSMHVTIAEGSTVYLDKVMDVTLQPGEETYVKAQLDLSGVHKVVDAVVTVQVENDLNQSNNIQKVTFGHVDTKIALDVYERNNNVMFVFSVVNNSNTIANAALSIIEDNENGIVIDVKNIGSITSDSYVQYLYTLDKANIDFDAAGHKTYFFKIDTLEADYNEVDNIVHYTVSRSPSDHTHQYEVVAFRWSEDYSACDVEVKCNVCGVKNMVACIVTSTTTPATNTENGKIVYTAEMIYEDQTYTDTQTVILPATELPDTGDHSNSNLWLMLMTAALVVMFSTLVWSRRRT